VIEENDFGSSGELFYELSAFWVVFLFDFCVASESVVPGRVMIQLEASGIQ
jgi:hypothetical protein